MGFRMDDGRDVGIFILSVFIVERRLTCKTMICVVTRTLFYFCLVAINGNCIIRLIARTRSRRILEIYPANAGTRPGDGLILNFFIFPMACGRFTAGARANASVAGFTIAIDELIRIRRIRIRNIPECFDVMLNIRIGREFLRLLRAVGPRLNKERYIRPYSGASAFLFIINYFRCDFGFLKEVNYAFVCSFGKRFT